MPQSVGERGGGEEEGKRRGREEENRDLRLKENTF